MNINQTLHKTGIVICDDIFSESEIEFLRKKFIENCGFLGQGDDRRYGGKGGTVKCKYLDLKDIYEMGLLEKITSMLLSGNGISSVISQIISKFFLLGSVIFDNL